MADFIIRPITPADSDWEKQFIIDHWGSDLMVAHGMRFYISQLPGFLAEANGEVVGLVSYALDDQSGCEITSLDSLREGQGIGTALIEMVKTAARQMGCQRLYLTTTNDNTHALRFYQRRGFVLTGLRPGAVDEARKIKPEIPWIGNDGIPIRDEIELEIILD